MTIMVEQAFRAYTVTWQRFGFAYHSISTSGEHVIGVQWLPCKQGRLVFERSQFDLACTQFIARDPAWTVVPQFNVED